MIHRLSFDSHGACARSSQSFQASSGSITSQTLELEARNKKWILFAQPQDPGAYRGCASVAVHGRNRGIKVILQEQFQQMRSFFF